MTSKLALFPICPFNSSRVMSTFSNLLKALRSISEATPCGDMLFTLIKCTPNSQAALLTYNSHIPIQY
ncbi:hypothetical protein Ahy_A04g017401 isoform B [Arachis hypogaea]|uniref:Uncharacterized protein n=1 Tax=Arachis hypogaea TaxID=3818 RepID=A0A445DAZ5_ARAHY|nr:hypothetical protein Ahy_A04g017401 isoform B [Arachis hypogaea]